jgi:hypothetical protein
MAMDLDREHLSKLKLEALRILAVEQGVAEAASLSRAQLIDRLAPHRGPVERAQEALEHAVERLSEKAHELAERVRHRHDAHDPRSDGDGHEPHAPAAPQRGSMGVPSSTVHPHLPPPPPSPPPTIASEPTTMLDYEELPETYGVDECEVLFKDPFWVFTYWEVTERGLEAARAQLGQSAGAARLVMRLFTTVPGDGKVDRELRDVDLTWNHGRRYLPAPRAGAHLRIAVGLLTPEGYFAPIAHSSLVRVPPAEPQPGPVEWMEVVPARGRGRTREPIVIVRRAGDHDERGLRSSGGGALGGSSPGAPGLGGGSLGGSSPTRRDPGAR